MNRFCIIKNGCIKIEHTRQNWLARRLVFGRIHQRYNRILPQEQKGIFSLQVCWNFAGCAQRYTNSWVHYWSCQIEFKKDAYGIFIRYVQTHHYWTFWESWFFIWWRWRIADKSKNSGYSCCVDICTQDWAIGHFDQFDTWLNCR